MTFCPKQCIDDGVKEILTDLGRPCRCCPQEKGFPGRKPCSWDDANFGDPGTQGANDMVVFLSKNVDDQRMGGCWWQGGPPNRDTRRWWSFFFNDDNDDGEDGLPDLDTRRWSGRSSLQVRGSAPVWCRQGWLSADQRTPFEKIILLKGKTLYAKRIFLPCLISMVLWMCGPFDNRYIFGHFHL